MKLKNTKFGWFLAQLQQAADQNDWDVRMNYSGRGMFGRTCLGVVVSSTNSLYQFYYDLGQASIEYDDEPGDFADPAIPLDPRTDNMGHAMIVYWPEVATEEVSDGGAR